MEHSVHVSAFAFILVAIVLLLEIATGVHRRIWTRNDALITGLSFAIGFSLSKLLTGLVVGVLLGWAIPQYRGALAGQPVWPWFFGILLFEDAVFYWIHRYAHDTRRANWLWRMHRVHHAPPYLNVALVMRVHPLYYLLFPPLYTITFAIYSGMVEVALMLPAAHIIWQVMVHSAWRWDQPLRRIPGMRPVFWLVDRTLTTPTSHHAHHGARRNGTIGRNFAGNFAVLDWMFGTLYIPPGAPERYGLPMWRQPWVEQIFYPFVKELRQNALPAREPAPAAAETTRSA
jgi:sterol desaturase/sphingolipid hydroxylase (fatty acid hydroxylase superfamily)